MYTGFAAFDFDGTLFSPRCGLPQGNIEMLNKLTDRKICRAVVSGRSLFSFNRMVKPDFPIDFLIFSSGAGVMDWRTKTILLSYSLQPRDIKAIMPVLKENHFDFMIHKAIPNNHDFFYYRQNPENLDFNTRVEAHYSTALPLDEKKLPEEACQFVAILPPEEVFPESIMMQLGNYSIIRATSPLDDASTWMEIFPAGVDKGSGIRWLLSYLGIEDRPSLGVGNDYNDLEMLETVKSPFVMAGSPGALTERFPQAGKCEDAGPVLAVERWLKENF